VQCCLEQLREREHVHGTEVYILVVHKFTNIYYNKHQTLLEKIHGASCVVFFFRLWRLWIYHHDSYKLSEHFISREAFQDVEIGVHYAVNFIRATRDFAPQNPVDLEQAGTDCCEKHFSKLGGMVMNRRVYNLLQMVESDSALRQMKFFETDEQCPLKFPDLAKNMSNWHTEELIGPPGKPMVYPTDEEA